MKEPRWKLFDVTAIYECQRAQLAMFFGWKVCDTLYPVGYKDTSQLQAFVSRQWVGNQNLVSNYYLIQNVKQQVPVKKKISFAFWLLNVITLYYCYEGYITGPYLPIKDIRIYLPGPVYMTISPITCYSVSVCSDKSQHA